MKTGELERLYRDAEQGKIPFLNLEDEFRWSGCTMCGLCCFDIDILLNPYDILRLRRHLRCATSDLIHQGLVEIFPGGSSGLPLAMITFRKLDNQTSVCPFLVPVVDGGKLREQMKENGRPSPEDLDAARIPNRYGCGVYDARPSVCRSSPLGRMTIRPKEDDENMRLFYQPPTAFCPATQSDGIVRVADWIKGNGVQQYWDASERFHRLCSSLVQHGLVMKEGGNPAVAIVWNLAASILYDFDSLELLNTQFAQNRAREYAEEDVRILSQLFQMVEAMGEAVREIEEMPRCKVRW